MLHLVTDGFFDIVISAEISIHIFVTFFPFITILFFKGLIDKHLSDYFPNDSMLHNPATQKQSATL